MNKEDKKLQEDLVNEMMKVSKTNPDVMIYMQSLMKCYEDLEKENQQLKKQKDDVVEYIKENKDKTIMPYGDNEDTDYEVCLFEEDINEILRMLGEIDVEDN